MERAVRSMFVDVVERTASPDGVRRVTIAANQKVRKPPDLDLAGLSTENYTRNPVVMWAHDVAGRSPSGGLPIGRTLRIHRGPEGRMAVDFEFLADDPFAQRVKNAWDKGFLNAASISWLPLETVPGEGGRWRDTRGDLLEWSIVPVPADPDALRRSHQRLVDSLLEEGLAPAAEAPGGAARAGPLSSRTLADLAQALSLLRGVVEGVEAGPGAPSTAPGAGGASGGAGPGPADLSPGDAEEIRAAVLSIKALVTQQEG